MKNFLIIGASSGIGKSLLSLLVAEGHKVYATYNQRPIEENTQVVATHLDITSKFSSMDFLPEKLDGFVYCPGSIQLRPFARIKPQSFILDFELQVGGAIKTTWVTEITQVKDKAYFVDEQRVGPYTIWHHEHFIEPLEGGVLMKDMVIKFLVARLNKN